MEFVYRLTTSTRFVYFEYFFAIHKSVCGLRAIHKYGCVSCYSIYMTACLLKFYQQLRIYEEKAKDFQPFNLEKPLWVFVGSTVSSGKMSKDEQIVATDVALIIQFIADWYPRIQAMQSRGTSLATQKDKVSLREQHLALLDYDTLFFELERFKRERSWYNFNITKDFEQQLKDPTVILNSFILSWTRYPQLKWDKTQDALEDMHVLFMTNDRDRYIDKLFSQLRGMVI
jgi:hypothetical protein